MKKSDRMKAPRLWLVIAKSYRALSLLAEQSIANTGLCLTDFAALEALLHKGPLTISEIQDKVRLASGSMTAAVDRLEKLRLVVRKSSPSDRRARVVELTAQGKRLAASCFERHAQDLEALMSVLSEREMEQLHGSTEEARTARSGKASPARQPKSRSAKNKPGIHKMTSGTHFNSMCVRVPYQEL